MTLTPGRSGARLGVEGEGAVKLGLGLALALVAALVLNIGFFVQHGATHTMLSLSPRHPFGSVRLLVTNRQWMLGYATGWVGWGLYIAALSLAPLSLVQAVAAGGVGVLAFWPTGWGHPSCGANVSGPGSPSPGSAPAGCR